MKRQQHYEERCVLSADSEELGDLTGQDWSSEFCSNEGRDAATDGSGASPSLTTSSVGHDQCYSLPG